MNDQSTLKPSLMPKPLLFDRLAAVPDALELTGPGGRERLRGDPFAILSGEFSALAARDGHVWLLGNGGSSAIAAHIACDLVGRRGIFATALGDVTTMTAIANDHGYARAYEHQLRLGVRSQDLVVAISSSGESDNVVRAATFARQLCRVVTLSGMSPANALRRCGHINAYLEFDEYSEVELGHLAILHECVWRVGSTKEVAL